MSTPKFREMFAAAAKAGCPYLRLITAYQDTNGDLAVFPIVGFMRAAREIYAAGRDFVDSIDALVGRVQPRYKGLQSICPLCGSPYCSGPLDQSTVMVVKLTTFGPPFPGGK